jgi:uncharacterized protein YndB with AHSA1/START domain
MGRCDMGVGKGRGRLLAQPDPPAWSGSRTEIRAHAVVPGTPRQVWKVISDPKWWLGTGGSGSLEDSGSFDIQAFPGYSPDLRAEGTFLVEERPKRLVLTWSWTTYREIEVETPYDVRIDPATGEVTRLNRPGRGYELVPSWPLPVDGPTEIEFQLRSDGKGNTAVAVEHRGLPEELAGPMQSFWAWALRALLPFLTDAPLFLPPWTR